MGAAGAGLTLGTGPGDAQPPVPPRERTRKRVLIIDSHVHLKHGDETRSEWPAKVIVATMDKAGVDKSIVFAICTSARRALQMAEDAAKGYPDRLIPYAYALPSYERPVLKDLEAALKGRLFRGIKVHAGECRLPDYIIDPVLRLAGRFDVPCLIDVVGSVADARRMARAFPETTIIYAHMGRYNARDPKMIDAFIELAQAHRKVFLDLSGVELVAKIEEGVRRAGADKLIWGTDGPYPKPDLVTFTRNELDKVRRLRISQQDKDKILGGNMARLLKMNANQSGTLRG
jgi:predicted TIM-barrel fold metal-dependent hydrolase